MKSHCFFLPSSAVTILVIIGASLPGNQPLTGGELILTLQNDKHVTFVGAVKRWDDDGNHRRPVDPKARIDKPAVDAVAKKMSHGRWSFTDLSPGRYDLVIMTDKQQRIEGFHYPPVLEFDQALRHKNLASKSTSQWIRADIAKSRHYENKVTPLYLAGDEKQVRVLVQLLRDKPTSFDATFGQPVATLRHEVWQYTFRFGAWSKEKRTKVLDRLLMGKTLLRRWTWVWAPQLGGIKVGSSTAISYKLPDVFDAKTTRGLLPATTAPK